MTLTWEQSTIDDVLSLAPRLRDIDKQEITDLSGNTPAQALAFGCTGSRMGGTIKKDGVAQAMFGVVQDIEQNGVIWFLCSDDFCATKADKLFFLERSRAYIEEVQKDYPLLLNFTSARNRLAIKWLEWLGFEVFREYPLAFGGRPYFYFSRKRKDV